MYYITKEQDEKVDELVDIIDSVYDELGYSQSSVRAFLSYDNAPRSPKEWQNSIKREFDRSIFSLSSHMIDMYEYFNMHSGMSWTEFMKYVWTIFDDIVEEYPQ